MRKSTSLLTITLVFLALGAVAFLSNQYPTYAEDDHGNFRNVSTHLNIGAGAISEAINTGGILLDIDYFSFQAARGVEYTLIDCPRRMPDSTRLTSRSLTSTSSPE